jgi:hypothetical protein
MANPQTAPPLQDGTRLNMPRRMRNGWKTGQKEKKGRRKHRSTEGRKILKREKNRRTKKGTEFVGST